MAWNWSDDPEPTTKATETEESKFVTVGLSSEDLKKTE